MVSSTAVSQPDGGGGQLRGGQGGRRGLDHGPGGRLQRTSGGRQGHSTAHATASAAVVLWSRHWWTRTCAAQHPERKFPGSTDVEDLAAAVVGLFSRPPPS